MRFRTPRRLAHHVTEPSDGGTPGPAPLAVFLRRLPGGPTLVLVDMAAVIWLLAVDGEEMPIAVADVVGEPLDDIRADVEEYLNSLLSQDLLEAVEPDPTHAGGPS